MTRGTKEPAKQTVINLSPFIQFVPPVTVNSPQKSMQAIEEVVISGSFKVVVTSETGGRIFLCGGSKTIARES